MSVTHVINCMNFNWNTTGAIFFKFNMEVTARATISTISYLKCHLSQNCPSHILTESHRSNHATQNGSGMLRARMQSMSVTDGFISVKISQVAKLTNCLANNQYSHVFPKKISAVWPKAKTCGTLKWQHMYGSDAECMCTRTCFHSCHTVAIWHASFPQKTSQKIIENWQNLPTSVCSQYQW